MSPLCVMHIGGFLGNNYTTVTACYWKNNHEQGIGYNRESTGATKVDGSVVTWQKASAPCFCPPNSRPFR